MPGQDRPQPPPPSPSRAVPAAPIWNVLLRPALTDVRRWARVNVPRVSDIRGFINETLADIDRESVGALTDVKGLLLPLKGVSFRTRNALRQELSDAFKSGRW